MRIIDLRRTEIGMRRLHVSRARRSYGSMFMLDFGPLRKYGVQRPYTSGTYTLLVEVPCWVLMKAGRFVSSNNHNTKSIDRAMKQLTGARVLRVSLSAQKVEIDFSAEMCLTIWPDESLFGEWFPMGNWTLYHQNKHVFVTDHLGRWIYGTE